MRNGTKSGGKPTFLTLELLLGFYDLYLEGLLIL
jgi:hypothetical protein